MNQTENIPEVLFKAREGDNEYLGKLINGEIQN